MNEKLQRSIDSIARFLNSPQTRTPIVENSIDRLPKNPHEISPNLYYQSLETKDKVNAQWLTSVIEAIDKKHSLGVTVLAVGSSVKNLSLPQEVEKSKPHDLDYRILLNADRLSGERQSRIKTIDEQLGKYLLSTTKRLKHDFGTSHPGVDYSKITPEEFFPYLDCYNNDPSFVATYKVGLPIHISISGINNPPTKDYLLSEKTNQGHISILYQSPFHS